MKTVCHEKTAILLIGFQNDYFNATGALHAVINEEKKVEDLLARTLNLINIVKNSESLIIHTPILFANDYHELKNPSGLMQHIKSLGAFRRNSFGGETVQALQAYGERIIRLEGKTGFNAFVGTQLHELLQQHQIQRLLLCGVVTSICIDSTGRAASDNGYEVNIVSDCTGSRNAVEQKFYLEEICPLYANIINSRQLCLAQVS